MPNSKGLRAAIYAGIALVLALLIAGIVRVSVYTYVDVHEFAYTFNAMTGEAQPVKRKGYIATLPLLVSVYTIDTRPVEVCITAKSRNSAEANRTLNCQLVRYNPEGFQTWLEYQGSGSYNGAALEDTLKAYAYEDAGRDYSFLEVMVTMDATDMQE